MTRNCTDIAQAHSKMDEDLLGSVGGLIQALVSSERLVSKCVFSVHVRLAVKMNFVGCEEVRSLLFSNSRIPMHSRKTEFVVKLQIHS